MAAAGEPVPAAAEPAVSRERYELAARASGEGVWDWDLRCRQVHLSPGWREILGISGEGAAAAAGGPLEPVHGGAPFEPVDEQAWLELVHEEDLPRLRAAIDAHLAGQTPRLHSEHRMRHADGGWRWVLARGVAVRDPAGAPARIVGSICDITDRRAAERQLQHDALHDALTGLPNRALFLDRVDQVVQRSARDPSAGCAVLFLDADRFKLVNDTLSHAAGDQLLVSLAGRITEVVRPGDTVARLGGDEFTVLLDRVLTERDASVVAERIQRSLERPFEIDGRELRITASIGIAVSSPWTTAAELLRDADIAMYDAKRRGRGRIAVFTEGLRRRALDRRARERDLRRAVRESLLEVHYQPIVALGSGRICGIEALARWPDGWPDLAPSEFVAIAEQTGMIGALGLHVLEAGLEQLAAWRIAGLVDRDVWLSVNVSGRQLDDPALAGQIGAAIEAADLPAGALRLEVAESTLMQEPERIRRIVSEVCAGGVGLHLDEFGTGYLSLAALHRLPASALKIDRSLLSPVEGAGDAVIAATVALARSLGLGVIAVGVETPAQLERVRMLGCEQAQGFLLSRPLCAEAMQALLADWPSVAAPGGAAPAAHP